MNMTERIIFQTEDHAIIVGDYTTSEKPKAGVLLLHMMPADRKSWTELGAQLEARNIASLAIDLRGHGESTQKNGNTLDYREFSNEQHRESSLDVDAALFYLQKRGFPMDQIAIVGASIGANLALDAAVRHPAIPAIVLLSPGENFRGILTYPLAIQLSDEQSLLAAASQGDDQESFEAAKHIEESAACKTKQLLTYTSAGHGTNLFLHDKSLPEKIAAWIDERFIPKT